MFLREEDVAMVNMMVDMEDKNIKATCIKVLKGTNQDIDQEVGIWTIETVVIIKFTQEVDSEEGEATTMVVDLEDKTHLEDRKDHIKDVDTMKEDLQNTKDNLTES
jgi:hypothetical protein